MNSFSFSRCTKYCLAEFSSGQRQLTLTILAGMGLILSIYFLFGIGYFYALVTGSSSFSPMNAGSIDRIGYGMLTPARIITIGLLVSFIAVNIAQAFKNYHKSLSAPFAMLIPASKSEKFIYPTLLNAVIIPLLAFGLYMGVDTLFLHIYGLDSVVQMNSLHEMIMHRYVWYVILNCCLFISIFLFGSILFRRRQLIYTVLSIFGISIVFSSTASTLLFLVENHNIVTIIFPSWVGTTIEYALPSIATLTLWVLTWYKFKKIQIR